MTHGIVDVFRTT